MWNFIEKVFTNAWVIGIGGGIISGIIVYFITAGMLHRKEKRKHIEQIDRANIDIICSLRPFIAEKGLPDKEIIESLILSTARKHKLKTEELYSIRIICEELISEIIDNVYASMEKKQYYTEHLREYLHNLTSAQNKDQLVSDIKQELSNITKHTKAEYQEKIITLFGIMSGIMTALVSSLSILEFKDLQIFEFLGGAGDILIPIVVSILCSVCLSVYFTSFEKVYKYFFDIWKRRYDKKKGDKEDLHI